MPNEPLAIRVTVPARENVALRAMVRQVIPILRNPERHGKAERLQLAQSLAQALGGESVNPEEDEPDWDGPVFSDAETLPDEVDASNGCYPSARWEWVPE